MGGSRLSTGSTCWRTECSWPGPKPRSGLDRPSPAELLVTGAEFALDFLGPGREAAQPTSSGLGSLAPAGREAIDEIRHPERLAGRGPRHLTKAVLFPARFLFTAATGRVGTNPAAVDHYLARPDAAAPDLVSSALRWRTEPPDPGPAARLLQRELLPLYVEYIEDHATRLRHLGSVDLAAAFTAWREQLTA